MAAITALTAQNTRGVSAVHVPPAAFLTAQLDAISQDITIDAVKIGMLGDAAVIDAVRSWLEKARPASWSLIPSWWRQAATGCCRRPPRQPCTRCCRTRT